MTDGEEAWGDLHTHSFCSDGADAPEGVVRETRCWGKSRVDLLPWQEVEHVTLAFFKGDMMAFFERRDSVRGVRLYFSRQDEWPLRGLLKEFIPGVEVATQEKKF